MYFSLIEPHLILLRKYWSDCPFNIYINIDKDKPDNNLDTKYNFTYINSSLEGRGDNILDRLVFSLNELKNRNYKYILFLLDDTFLTRENNTKDILETLKFLKNNCNEVGSMLLHPSPTSKNFYKKMNYQGYHFGDNIYQSNIPIDTNIIDHICGHCIDKLYTPGKKYFPHRDADFKDKLINHCNQPKTDFVNWCKLNRLVSQVAFWEIEFFLNGLNKLINPPADLNILKNKENKYGNDWSCFELFATKYNKKYNIFNSKFILTPDMRSKIIYQNRGFKGSCIYRGWLVKWGRQILEENNINIKYYNGYYVINTDSIKSQKKCLTDNEHFNYIEQLDNKNKYTN